MNKNKQANPEKIIQWSSFHAGLIGITTFSIMVNLLMLTGPIFMMQVYDRVLASRSTATLWALLAIVGVLYIFMGILDYLRAGVMSRMAIRVCDQLAPNVFSLWVKLGLFKGQKHHLPSDLTQLWQYLCSRSPLVFFDIPWVPLYIGLLFMLHWVLGMIASLGVLSAIILAIINDMLSKQLQEEVYKANEEASEVISYGHEGSEAVISMGMERNLSKHWQKSYWNFMHSQLTSRDRTNAVSTLSRTLRLFLQSMMLAVGAWLAIQDYMSLGGIIASSIILGRAMAPIDQMIGDWHSFQNMKKAYRRLNDDLPMSQKKQQTMLLPPPNGSLEVNIGWAGVPNLDKPILEKIKFRLEPGQSLGVIGPSASGKTTLARLLVGLTKPNRGFVRLDKTSYDLWDSNALGRFIGYLPQDCLLLSGTIRQNICRFAGNADDSLIMEAARQAGVHEMILSMPQGYDSQIGQGGGLLSGGQRQRIGLARAMYNNPPLLVLDEPNANLDAEGDAALTQAVKTAAKRGQIVIVIAHRPSAIAAVDWLLALNKGQQTHFGPKHEVLKKLSQPR